MRTIAARRIIAGAALAVGLPLALAGVATAQSGPSGPSGPSGGGGGATTTTSTTLRTTTTSGTGANRLAETGGDLAIPLVLSGGAASIVLAGRRLAARA